jgi:hypothetical protein
VLVGVGSSYGSRIQHDDSPNIARGSSQKTAFLD